MRNITLDFDRLNETLNLMSKEKILADICNVASSGFNNFTKFTPKNSAQVIENYLLMLVWFNDWKVIAFSKY